MDVRKAKVLNYFNIFSFNFNKNIYCINLIDSQKYWGHLCYNTRFTLKKIVYFYTMVYKPLLVICNLKSLKKFLTKCCHLLLLLGNLNFNSHLKFKKNVRSKKICNLFFFKKLSIFLKLLLCLKFLPVLITNQKLNIGVWSLILPFNN